jgi:hypothetical protein
VFLLIKIYFYWGGGWNVSSEETSILGSKSVVVYGTTNKIELELNSSNGNGISTGQPSKNEISNEEN